MKLNKFLPRERGQRTRRLSLFSFLCVAFLTFFSFKSEASHYRYGNISWTWNTGRSVTFHIAQAYRRSYPWPTTPNVGSIINTETFNFGDNTSTTIQLTVTSVNIAEDWFYGEATITKTYNADGNFTAFYASNARLSTLKNNNDQPYRSQTVVTIGAAHNSSPASTMPPIVNVADGQASTTFQLAAVDPDGQSLTYRAATSAEMGGVSFPLPYIVKSVSASGLVTLKTDSSVVLVDNLYNAAFMVTDALGATTMIDVLIKIVQPSTPPSFDYSVTPANATVYDIQPGQNVAFSIKALDTDPGDIVTLNAVGLPSGSVTTPLLPSSGNPKTATFSWTPTSAQLGTRIVSFIAQDVNGNQTTTNVTITVSMNPIFDVPPTPDLNTSLCVQTGVPYTQTIQAHAPDPLVTLQIASATTLSGVTYSPSVPTAFANTKSTTLNWTPTAAQWGPHTFNYTATDNLGHSKLHTFELVANTPPVFTSSVPATTISENQPFVYNIVASDPDMNYGDELEILGTTLPDWLSLTDNGDGTATLSGTPNSTDIGSNEVQIDLEDSFHHCHNQVAQLFYIDVVPCAFTEHITPSVVGNQCPGTSVTLTADAADSYTWSNGAHTQSITVTANGTNTYTVDAVSGYCSSSASATVTGIDNTAPVADAANIDVSGECSVTVTAPTATDNCTGTITGTTSDATSYNAQGTYVIHWTYNDGNGNSSTQDQTVTVDDITAPVADVASLPNVTGECSATATAPTATDNCVGSVTATTSDPLTYNAQGTYTINWTYNDGNGNTSNQTQTVIVHDVTAPVADVAALPNVTGECSATATAPTATDNCMGSVTATTSDPLTYNAQGTYTINWTYNDGNGNTSSQTQTVIVHDVTAPVANVGTLPTVTGQCSASVTAPTATDNCTGTRTGTTSDPLSYNAEGTYTVHWTYSDGNGNSSTQNQTVIVHDTQNPTITAPANVTKNGWCTNTTVTLGTPVTNDNCGVASVTNNAPATFPVGTTTVTWTVTDVHGLTATATQTVTVNPATVTGSFNTEPDRITVACPGGYILWGYDTDIAVTVGGGTAPYSYNWTAGATGTTSTGTFGTNGNPPAAFTVVVTDAHACSVTLSKTTCITDVRCGNANNMDHKVTICHKAGNKWNTICVDENAVSSHLAHGDMIGACNLARHGNLAAEAEFQIFPNPSNGSFTITLVEEAAAKVTVTDIQGRVVFTKVYEAGEPTVKVEMPSVTAGIYFLNVENGTSTYKTKISVQ